VTTQIPRTVLIGDLVAAAFDRAPDYDTDPVKISALATRAVTHILWQSRRVAHETSTHQKKNRLRRNRDKRSSTARPNSNQMT
jgi:hypothetical protein